MSNMKGDRQMAPGTNTKDSYVGLRLTPAEREKVLTLKRYTAGSISETIRQLIAQAPMPTIEGAGLGQQHNGGSWYPEGEVAHG